MSTVYWKLWPLSAGGVPAWPAVTDWLCDCTTLITSLGERPKV